MANYGRKRAGIVNMYIENRKPAPLWGTSNNLNGNGNNIAGTQSSLKKGTGIGFNDNINNGNADYDRNFPSFEESKQQENSRNNVGEMD